MKKWALVAASTVLLLLQTSCWNSKDIQNMAYVTAVGFDYENGKYMTYVQVLNFSNVAKGEAAEVGKNVPTWIGKGEGVTVTESFNSIYATSQLRIFWGHVKAIVASERFLKNSARVREAYDMANRYREIRYNILIYGTKEPLRNIFAQKSNLNMSPLETLLATPAQTYSQRSYILPLYGYKMIAQFNEPAGAALLPSITLDQRSWTEDLKERTMFKIDGGYFLNGQQFNGWLSEQDLEGYRWLQKKLQRSPINIPDDDSPDAAIVLIKPKPSIHHEVRNGKAYFHVKLSIQAFVDELIRNRSKKEIEAGAAKVIEDQIRKTYEKGLQIKADVLGLGSCLYRDNPKMWHEMQDEGDFALDKDSLDRIEVKVKLQHSGKYKMRVQ
ncbi:Ger(x)C family spore germination protein [Paenibacillus contaminans]|uniref:Ger(X)C family spore germination protein n=1 Tax=Paenibacillus contaminans TaxID=450362 RepID=A0A329MR21_9BACL|nr:Ger(x)C family spore germination protein [Paenibacillus contaminans]RAV21183.1 Ger(x)C family spore germination protein [Paenibacillus contaminans]